MQDPMEISTRGTGGSRTASLCGFAAIALALATPLVGGAARPGYSHVAQYISELGELGAVNGAAISALGFAPTGIAVLLFLALAAPSLPRARGTALGLACFASVGLAYLAAALAPCDAGCPTTGAISTRQAIHNVFGAFEYAGAFTGLLSLGAAFRRAKTWRGSARASFFCAGLVGAGFVAMLLPSLVSVRGVAQRIAELGAFLWIGIVSLALLRRQAESAPR
jgi:hypothetical protein